MLELTKFGAQVTVRIKNVQNALSIRLNTLTRIHVRKEVQQQYLISQMYVKFLFLRLITHVYGAAIFVHYILKLCNIHLPPYMQKQLQTYTILYLLRFIIKC